MNQKKHWSKHVLTLIILGVFAFLAGGSFDADEKGLKAYQAGDYEKAKKIWEKSSDVREALGYGNEEACWLLGELYSKDGDEENAIKYKLIAWNKINSKQSDIDFMKRHKPDLYNRMINDPQIKELLAKQEKERKEKAAVEAKKGIVGTWSFYTINKDGKSYSKSNLKRYPQQVVFKENGTGYVNTPTYPDGAADHSNFTWSYKNGELTTSLTAMRVGINEEGYVWCNCSAITKNMGLERVFVFFKKD